MRHFLPVFDAPADAGAATESADTATEENPYDGGESFDDMMAQLDEAEGGSVFDRMAKQDEEPEEETEGVDQPETTDDAEESVEEPAEPVETTDAEEPEAETKEAPKLDFSEIESMLEPGAVIESMEDLSQHIGRYRESHQIVEQLDALVSNDEHLQTYLTEIKNGTDTRIAAIKAFGDLAKVPDPNDDPEGYAEWKAEQKAARVRAEFEKEKQGSQKQRLDQISKQAGEAFDGTVKRRDLPEDEQKSLAHFFQSLTQGDPVTGRFRRDAFDILHNGMQFGNIEKGLSDVFEKASAGDMKGLAAAEGDHPLVKKAKKTVRDAFLAGGKQAGKAKKEIPSTPDLTGSRGDGGDLTPREKEAQQFARSLQTESWEDHPLVSGKN